MLDAAGVQAEKESEGALTPDCSREGRWGLYLAAWEKGKKG